MLCEKPDVPLVSVVIPAYKHEEFLCHAMQSVFEQDYPSIELIVIDDASPDNTAGEIALWAANPAVIARFNRFVFLINPDNQGAHSTINRGCAEARGKYIAILNSDDMFHPARIRKLVAQLETCAGHLAFSRVVPIDKSGGLVSPASLPNELIGVFDRADHAVANSPSMTHAFMHGNIGISTGNFVFSQQLYDDIGPFSDLKYVHDWDFAIRSTALADPIYVPEDLYLYRVHGSNSFAELGDVATFETRVVYARFFALRRSLSLGPLECQDLGCG